MIRLLMLPLLVMLAVAACTPAATPVPVATQALIPAEDTPTPTPAPPTATVPPLSAPDELATPTAEEVAFSIPAAAQPLLQSTIENLSERLEIERTSIELLQVEAATWAAVDLGCGDNPMPGAGEIMVDGFRVVLSVSGVLYEYHTDNAERIRLCPDPDIIEGGRANELLLTDPVAAELVALAQRRLAADLDLSTRRIRLVDLTPVTWPDTSLGCPLPEQTYTERPVAGYRIVLAAGVNEYIFHADFDRVEPCAEDDEVLPE